MAELDELQDEVLRCVGRNVLNLQRMEGMLKFIVSTTGKFDVALDTAQRKEDLERFLTRRRKEVNRLPMGRLVDSLSKALQSDDAGYGETANSEDDFGFEVSFRIEDEDFSDELSQALRLIVCERNELIHKKLISFNYNSADSCRNLISELDEQRARITPQFGKLAGIVLGLTDFFKQLKDYAEQDSFTNDLKRAIEEQG